MYVTLSLITISICYYIMGELEEPRAPGEAFNMICYHIMFIHLCMRIHVCIYIYIYTIMYVAHD